MTRLFCTATMLLGLMPWAALPPLQQSGAPRTATIRGTVTDAATGRPLPMARVRLSTVKPGAAPDHHARTDAGGRYEFRNVAPGPVHITAAKARYVALQHGQEPPASTGRPLEVTAGAVLERIDLALPRASAIAGRVVDEHGEPLENASVAAVQTRYVNGRRQPAQVGGASTNDNGEYRIPALQPGSYYVVAAERSAGFGASMEADIGFARTAFPGVVSLEAARAVEVQQGLDTTGVDFSLVPSPTARLSGVVIGRDGQPASGAWVVLQAVGAGPGAGLGGDLRTGADGRFLFPRVLAGRYDLHVRGNAKPEGAVIPLVVSDDAELNVPLVSGRMTGRVVLPEGAALSPSAMTISIVPVAETNVFGTGFGGAPKDDWTFDFDFLLGPRVIRARLPEGWYLAGVYQGSTDVTDRVFSFRGNEIIADLEVVLTREAAAVTGTIAGENGQPCATCTAILFAEDAARWAHPSRFIHAGKPDQQDVFRIEGAPPGQYLVAAVERIDDGEWLDPEFLDRLRSRAERIDLRQGGSVPVSLKVVRP